ncbi:MAG: hypothetical protein ACJAUD_000982 [Crocinitomicaceae bacterium]|jgi:hypothetical protein
MIQEINIKFDRKAFEAMYFNNYEDSYLLGPKTKIRFIAALVISILMPIITISGYNSYPMVMLLSWVAFFLIWVDYLMMIYKTGKWKKGILKKLDEQSQVKSMKIQLTEESITLIEDGNKKSEQWSNFNDCQMSAVFILLNGETNYFFPSSCMLPEDYKIVSRFVKSKMDSDALDLLDDDL